MTNTYPFSQGTVEGDALGKLSKEEQVAILQNTEVWDNARAENKKIIRILDNASMDKLTLTKNGETKEIHIQRNFLKLSDDSALKYTLSNGALSNFPENKIKDNPLLITKNKDGDYHFGHTAALEEAKKIGMRLATNEEMDSPEFNKYVVENTTEFPGFRYADGSGFWNRGDYASFWSASTDGDNAYNMEFHRGDSRARRDWNDRSHGLSVRLVKD